MTEDQIQAQIVREYTNKYCLQHHQPRCLILSIPNGGTRNKIEAMKLKATGLLPGASDLIIVHMGVLIWVEVKTETGKHENNQKAFQARVEALGYRYELVRSVESFWEMIESIDNDGGCI